MCIHYTRHNKWYSTKLLNMDGANRFSEDWSRAKWSPLLPSRHNEHDLDGNAYMFPAINEVINIYCSLLVSDVLNLFL